MRYGVPDIGLLGMRDFAEAYRDILAVSDLPVLVDADNGYGDVKNILYLLHTYERLGANRCSSRTRFHRSAAGTWLASS